VYFLKAEIELAVIILYSNLFTLYISNQSYNVFCCELQYTNVSGFQQLGTLPSLFNCLIKSVCNHELLLFFDKRCPAEHVTISSGITV